MRRIKTTQLFVLIVLGFGIHSNSVSQVYHIPDNCKRIIFIGNSITYNGRFIEFIDAYYTINHPEIKYEFINVGLPSETVSGLSEHNHADGRFPRPDLHERLKRILKETKPDMVIACYGMNDGIYLPFDEKRFNKYMKGITWLHNEVIKSGSEIIHVTPSVYEGSKGEAYANVMDIYSDWLKSKRYTDQWKVIDIHWPIKNILEDYRLLDSSFVFAKDGVHPTEHGHFLIAKYILLGLGEKKVMEINELEGILSAHPNGDEILALVEKRQRMQKDALLTLIGHKRPGMRVGLPMNEAQEKLIEIENQIKVLINEK